MPGAVTNPPLGVQEPKNVRAVSALSPNTRVSGTNGKLATVADVLVFPGPAPLAVSGVWTIPNFRVSIGGVRALSATSQGIALTTVGPPTVGPMIVSGSDTRISFR